jgi:hypothetical protein
MAWFALANFWLTFSIIVNLLVDPTGINLFGTPEIVSSSICACGEQVETSSWTTDRTDALGQSGVTMGVLGSAGVAGGSRLR